MLRHSLGIKFIILSAIGCNLVIYSMLYCTPYVAVLCNVMSSV